MKHAVKNKHTTVDLPTSMGNSSLAELG